MFVTADINLDFMEVLSNLDPYILESSMELT